MVLYLLRALSDSSTNFTNVNNNGNLNNNNASNANGVVPDSVISIQQGKACDNSIWWKEIQSCDCGPKRSHDVRYLVAGRSNYPHGSKTMFEQVIDPLSLLEAFNACKKGVQWKGSIQTYERSLLKNIANDRKTLEEGKIISKGFYEFITHERGKTRHIKAVHISERVVQKSLCTHVLNPCLHKPLIYDNGASIKNKGVSFARKRLKVHLMRHYRKHGNEGYILLLDCSKYFDSIDHDILIKNMSAVIPDKKAMELARQYVKTFGDRGLGIGSEVSQSCAVFFPNAIDVYAKEVLRIKEYGRYMDDSYAIFRTKEEAHYALSALKKEYEKLNLKLNDKKTQIVKISRGFTYMKIQYRFGPTGRIITYPSRDSKVRMSKKLRLFREMDITAEATRDTYKSWRKNWIKLGGNPIPTDKLFKEVIKEKQQWSTYTTMVG